LTWSVV